MSLCQKCADRREEGLCIRWGSSCNDMREDCHWSAPWPPCVLPYDHLGHCQDAAGISGQVIAAQFLGAK